MNKKPSTAAKKKQPVKSMSPIKKTLLFIGGAIVFVGSGFMLWNNFFNQPIDKQEIELVQDALQYEQPVRVGNQLETQMQQEDIIQEEQPIAKGIKKPMQQTQQVQQDAVPVAPKKPKPDAYESVKKWSDLIIDILSKSIPALTALGGLLMTWYASRKAKIEVEKAKEELEDLKKD